MKYYISFVEEGIMNPQYDGYVGGRIEVYDVKKPYAIEEIRFLTKKLKEYYIFRDTRDMTEITKKELVAIKEIVKSQFME